MHVLFLQGPSSFYMHEVARELIARGHRVSRINLHLGDRLFWRLPARDYRGGIDGWRNYIARFLDEQPITHLFLLGDRRPHHRIAIAEARARGAEIICSELGYLRPDWLVLERDGMGTWSRMPRNPALIRSLAQQYPVPDLRVRCSIPFWRLAMLDVAYNVSEVLSRPLYPGYRRHAIHHPFAEYAGWVLRWLRGRAERRRSAHAFDTLRQGNAPTFVFPLQLSTDYQIRDHSPYPDMVAAAREIIGSFAAHSPPPSRLTVKVHPLDPGLTPWRRRIREIAAQNNAADRVFCVTGGNLVSMLGHAAGCVLVNSTVGLTALQVGCPLKVMGSAIFDVPGMTFAGSIDDFWLAPPRPDADLVRDFIRLLAGALHVRGGYYTRQALDIAVPTTVQRLEDGLPWLPPRAADDTGTTC
ncbi:capsular biosynthesis protein [Accumulibacter sp.]|uniref:capsule biosynthesis protein n=1 Tax=Accumulibacter sp. TaxID=2053492 RepID=UPI0025F0F8A0|nr:capsular biosynthesis protein [Accumulibacter sp.]MCM8612195.1 capsular biosynthesis protein [Accumulibacter sp.]MCM8635868.1 capsular biosynthesis protein [Accumulibacter sp.]MCM8639523.1 capsular biosynthesis protein [Accumulibacter sp.]